MSDHMDRNVLLIKEHIGMFKAANNFDIFDPATGEPLLYCREEGLGPFTKILRFTDFKRYTPFDIRVSTLDGRQVVRIKRGVTVIRSHVQVFDEHDRPIGAFRQKLLSIGGAFAVLDPEDRELCRLTGKWTSWEFSFTAGDVELASVTKKWSGMGKELFTSADNYVLEISNTVSSGSGVRKLILAAVLCIDMVLKE